MKKLFYFLAAMAIFASADAQIGIGTTTPNANSILDIFSNNKGILIPRIGDTGIITNPLEGMIIYNKNTKTPYYHNGTQWVSLGGRLPTGVTTTTDKITYQITGSGFSATEEQVFSSSVGASLPVVIGGGGGVGNPSLSDFSLMKEIDINSKSLNLATMTGANLASIEIKYYATGSLVPYVSYRLQNIYISSYQTSGSAGGGALTESVSIAYTNYGFKDWVHSVEFGYNVVTHAVTAY